MRNAIVLALASSLACGGFSEDADLGDEMPEDLPAGSCRDTDAATTGGLEDCDLSTSSGDAAPGTTTAAESQCAASEECEGAGACVATWSEGVRGPFACQFACVPTLDESSWCSDDSACCDATARCTERGYCVFVSGDEDSTGS